MSLLDGFKYEVRAGPTYMDAAKNTYELVPIPSLPFRDKPHFASYCQAIEPFLDEVLRGREISVIGRVAEDLCEAGFSEIPETVT